MVTSSETKKDVVSAVSESTSTNNKKDNDDEKHKAQTNTTKEHDRPTLHRGDDGSSPSTRLLSTLKNAFHHLHLPHHHHSASAGHAHDEEQLKRFVQRHKWEQVIQWLNDEEKEVIAKTKTKQEMMNKGRVTETTSVNDTITRAEDNTVEEATDGPKDNALHIMCRHHPPVFIVRKTIQLMPHLIKQLNITNETPLHVAASHGASPQVIHLLVVNYPEACCKQDCQGRTPLHGHLYECSCNKKCDTGESYKIQEEHHVDRNVVNHDTSNTNHHWLVTEGPGVLPAVKNLAHEMSSKASAEEDDHSSQLLTNNVNVNQHSSISSTAGSYQNNKLLHMESRMLPVVQQYSKQLDHIHNLHHSSLVQGPLLDVVKDLCHYMSPQDMQLKDSSSYTPYEVAKKMNCNETIRNVIREAM